VASSLLSGRPNGFLRAGLRVPLWFYRLHLGWLLGDRFILLTHIGRVSGRPHQTVVEVVRHDKATGVCVVASGWGARSDWYRNIQKTPRVTVTLGNRTWAAKAVDLSVSEAESSLRDFARRHPIAFRELATLIVGRHLASADQTSSQLARKIPLVALSPVWPSP
jgi:deazaflavin-dependent oxidoreductase (nitroreductase family)